jgi:hypothetical protein
MPDRVEIGDFFRRAAPSSSPTVLLEKEEP